MQKRTNISSSHLIPESSKMRKTQHAMFKCLIVLEKTEEVLTVGEVARRLLVDETMVRRWIKSGALEAITLPHRARRQSYRIRKSTMETLLK
jgi:excisionase family DNA binding protein